jgi:hypothetical protein
VFYLHLLQGRLGANFGIRMVGGCLTFGLSLVLVFFFKSRTAAARSLVFLLVPPAPLKLFLFFCWLGFFFYSPSFETSILAP